MDTPTWDKYPPLTYESLADYLHNGSGVESIAADGVIEECECEELEHHIIHMVGELMSSIGHEALSHGMQLTWFRTSMRSGIAFSPDADDDNDPIAIRMVRLHCGIASLS